ncbi:MAG TPA: hypothetical protein VGI54_04125, partial [Solirubrobacteraceae bacterium]
MLATLGAPERRRLGRKRRTDDPEDPSATPVTTTRVTVIEATAPLADEAAARAHLRSAGEDEAEGAVRVLNRLLAAHRVAVRDAHLREVGRDQAIAVRVGYSGGDVAAEGRLVEAAELPAGGDRRRVRRRASFLRPDEHRTAILGGHAPALVSEELALRARADLAAGRERAAALELRSALEAAVAELAGVGGDLPRRVEELRGLLPAARACAAAAVAPPAPAEPPEVAPVKTPPAEAAPEQTPPAPEGAAPAPSLDPAEVERILGRLEA